MPLHTLKWTPEDCSQVIELIMDLRRQLRYSLSDERRRWTGMLRRSTLARAIQGSNSIEGYDVDYSDAIAAVDGEEPTNAKDKEWANILGYRQALTYVLQLTGDEAVKIEEATIRALHFMMLSHEMNAHPGIWRRGPVFVRRDPDNTVVHEGAPPEQVAELMRELVASFNERNDLPVMVRAALAHLNLVMIHPFSDGNGRMGRAVQTLVLAREKIVDPVFSSIEEWLGAHTQQYYDVLAEVGQGAWHPENDPWPFVRFCLQAHFQQAEKLVWQSKVFDGIWDAAVAEIKKRGLMERMAYAVADASVDFKTLVEHGLLIPKGERKGRYYEAPEDIKTIIHQSAWIKPVERDPFALVAEQARKAIQPELPGIAEHEKLE
jgi:Fic family protein